MDQRFKALQHWLEKELKWHPKDIQPASIDASFRRYFRVTLENSSFVVMDAPPEHESLEPFVSIARVLKKQGVNSPQIYEINPEQGFLLLQDLGNLTYLESFQNQNEAHHANSLYHDALLSLIRIQLGTWRASSFQLPSYDINLLEQELDLFTDWYLQEHLHYALNAEQLQTWQKTKQSLIEACGKQPQVWVHRDYHSRNLMLTTDNSPGVIDFQDMVVGPISYDLASLFKDCYIQWPRQQQLEWLEYYYQLAEKHLDQVEFSLEQLIRWYDLTGMQRHLKVLGIFCRLNYRDGKAQYLSDLPLAKNYVDEVLFLYPEFAEFRRLFVQIHQSTVGSI